MDAGAKANFGCFGSIAAVFLIVWLLVEMGSKPHPPLSDEEYRSIVAKQKADDRQQCIDTLRKSIPLMPKDAQKYAYAALAKCGDDDD